MIFYIWIRGKCFEIDADSRLEAFAQVVNFLGISPFEIEVEK